MRVHQTLRVTPTTESKITDHIWTWNELLNLNNGGKGGKNN